MSSLIAQNSLKSANFSENYYPAYILMIIT